MIVNFWATWCAPCRREIPLLRRFRQSTADEGFQVVGVAVDFREDVLKYAKEIGIDYPLLIGEQDGLDAVSKFGLGSLGFPFTVFTDNQHRIIVFHLGELDTSASGHPARRRRAGEQRRADPAAARTVAAKQLAEADPARTREPRRLLRVGDARLPRRTVDSPERVSAADRRPAHARDRRD